MTTRLPFGSLMMPLGRWVDVAWPGLARRSWQHHSRAETVSSPTAICRQLPEHGTGINTRRHASPHRAEPECALHTVRAIHRLASLPGRPKATICHIPSSSSPRLPGPTTNTSRASSNASSSPWLPGSAQRQFIPLPYPGQRRTHRVPDPTPVRCLTSPGPAD